MSQLATLADLDDPPRLGCAFTLEEIPGDWRAAQVKANCEKRLAFDLLHRQIPYYLPMGESVTRSGRKTRVTLVPLFKGYLFIAPPTDDCSAAFDTHRTLKVIPIKNQLRFRRELANVERALNACPRLEPCPFAVEGATVRVSRGAFEGVEGKVIRRGAGTLIVVGISGFGAATVEIDGHLLEPAA